MKCPERSELFGGCDRDADHDGDHETVNGDITLRWHVQPNGKDSGTFSRPGGFTDPAQVLDEDVWR